MRELTLEAEKRTAVGKHNRALRRSGKVPGIYYIHGEQNIPFTVHEKHLKPLITTAETQLINLRLTDGEAKSCILRDIQFDPITERPVHVDFQGLRDDEEIAIEIPVIVTGAIPVGVRDGGILQQFTRSIEIFSLPRYIPDHIEVSAEELKINHFIHVSDLKIENVKILEDADTTIVGVIPPTVEKEATPGTPGAEEQAEPEVIGKGKKPEEGAEGEATAAPADKKAEAAPPAKEEKKK
ncbi:MAG TPA: 50S ribosomal protein L25 [Bacteroidota bacterium]|nr:50S ribosomal protein L25 [Bacteroidota bacterium]